MMHRCDRMVKELNWRGIERVNYLGISILFIFYFVVAFLPIYFGADAPAPWCRKRRAGCWTVWRWRVA